MVAAVLWWLVGLAGAAPADPLIETAQYYYRKQEYGESLKLWSQALQKKPRDLSRLLKTMELSLLVEGRAVALSRIGSVFPDHLASLSPDDFQLFRKRFSDLQELFLSEEGQANYLQAQSKLEKKDYTGALAHLAQANSLEKEHPLVLKLKAETEMRLGDFRSAAQSWEAAFQANPFDSNIRESFTEALLYFGKADRALETLRKIPGERETIRSRQAEGVALSETGNIVEGMKILRSLADREKQWGLNPIVYFWLAKNLPPSANRPWLERYLNAATGLDPANGWDPYRNAEHIEEARRLYRRS